MNDPVKVTITYPVMDTGKRELDEIFLCVGERCVFHLERMDDHDWWFCLYADDQDVHASFRVKGELIVNPEPRKERK